MTSERKTQDYICQSQFMEFTGKSNRAIATAIQSCVERGWIVARDNLGELRDTPEKRARRKIWYQLGNVFTDKISGEESSLDNKNPKNLVNFLHQSGELNDINLVKKVHSTKETITKETVTKGDCAANAATPREEMLSFLKSPETEIQKLITARGKTHEAYIRREVEAFISHWTERALNGKRQRWEMEKTFDVSRRLGTWLRNGEKWNKATKNTNNILMPSNPNKYDNFN